MAFSGFETYDKNWYVLPNQNLEKIKTAQFGEVQLYKQGMFAQQKLLFITDYNKPLECYAPFFRALTTDFYVFSYDLLGQGGTEFTRTNTYDLIMFVDQLHHVFTHFGLANQPIHIAAQGLGCTIFAAFFAKYGGQGFLQVCSVTLITPTGINYRKSPVYSNLTAGIKRGCLCVASSQKDIEERGDQYQADLYGKSYQYFSMEQRNFCAYRVNQSREAILRYEFMQQSFNFTNQMAYGQLGALDCKTKQIVLVKYDEYTDNDVNRLFFTDNLPGFEIIELENTRNEVCVLTPSIVADILREITVNLNSNTKIMKISFND